MSKDDVEKTQAVQDPQTSAVEQLLAGLPRMVPVGTSVMLVDIREAHKYFPGQSIKQLRNLLTFLKIPTIHSGKKILFNLYTLEKVIFYLTRLGGRGFASPNSGYRRVTYYTKLKERARKGSSADPAKRKSPPMSNPILEITDIEINEMCSPEFEAERLACGPRGTDRAAYIRELAKKQKINSQAKPRPGGKG